MSAALASLNALPAGEAEARFLACCGSSAWARRMAAARPFGSVEALAAAADRTWQVLSKADWLEAFAAHPKIGGSEEVAGTGPAGLHPPPNSIAGTGFNLHPPPNSDRSRAWSRQEQVGTESASPETLANLADANLEYEDRFGHIFIVCASGRNAAEMLAAARERLGNDPETELAIAAEEQRKITRLRLERLLAPTDR